ncbi:hypothetical protein BX600DRAFT_504408 [Xylariales sp. PMI_506]|nr:hypothetical protein BX600DRAFT_504408 [Xylariales sp. PMI_506]
MGKTHIELGREEIPPPFTAEHSLVDQTEVIIPATVRRDSGLLFPERDLSRFLENELRTPKLNLLHRYLWIAGLPLPARPLQRQLLMNRRLVLTDRADEHLVWHRDCFFVKPLPEFLLCHKFWQKHLSRDEALRRSACGFVLSYAWLVTYRSDFIVAQNHLLLPPNIEWGAWVAFLKAFLKNVDLKNGEQIDKRYRYAELRKSRLDQVMRLVALTSGSLRMFVDGFMPTSTWYEEFFQRNFGWLIGAFVFFSVVLSAIQVGLAVEVLQDNEMFQSFSQVVALMTLAAVLFVTGMVFLVWVSLFWYHVLSTILFYTKYRG